MAAKKATRPAIDFGDPALPVAGTGSLSRIANSKRAPWRAAVLLGVHVLFLLHLTHYMIAGKTLSPVEPSESMYTLELGQLNAGFVFFGLALLSTLIFGRFFCGWGCHIVMLQDFCGWLMKKAGIRPRPFRSRWLLWLPMGVALYMFVWPTVKRWVLPDAPPFPGFSNHLMTDGFWETFPGPLFAILTFLSCGFVAVYFLGAKGFCSYGCPYGAFFGFVERAAPGRIRVTDDCEQCGHCTATCTSNVRVHQEVRDHGMVVDPGCMKCMDCVSVCPKDALYFGYGRPALFLPKTAGKKRKRSGTGGLDWKVEAAVAVVAVAAMLAFRGLYDGPPLLMSVGLGAITGYLALRGVQLLRRGEVRIQNLILKQGGAMRPAGWIAGSLIALWLLFSVHSGFVQWHRHQGARWLERTEATRADVYSGRAQTMRYSEQHAEAARKTREHFSAADRWGLFPVIEVELGLAWSDLLEGETSSAIERIRGVVEMAPSSPRQHENLIEVLMAGGRAAEAATALQQKIAQVDPELSTAEDRFRLGMILASQERFPLAAAAYREGLELEPDRTLARYHLGGLLRRLERFDEAIQELERAQAEQPSDADTRVELGLSYRAVGRHQEAIEALRSAIELNPQSPESRLYLPGLIEEIAAEGRGESMPGSSSLE